MGYVYVFFTILFTVYGQIVLKWQLSMVTALPQGKLNTVWFLVRLILTNPYVFSGFCAAFIASLCWMMALRAFPLSIAYPFMSLSFVLVTVLSILIFGESVALTKLFGLMFIVVGAVMVGLGHHS